jgi:hypothetical protein
VKPEPASSLMPLEVTLAVRLSFFDASLNPNAGSRERLTGGPVQFHEKTTLRT